MDGGRWFDSNVRSNRNRFCYKLSLLAQMVEHCTVNAHVTGSSPVQGVRLDSSVGRATD